MISKKLAIDVLNEALSTGADYAEIFYEDSHSHNVVIERASFKTSIASFLLIISLPPFC